MREYIALGPKDIGRLGCFWMTDEMLGLLDSLFMVRTFRISQPTDYGMPLIQPLQCNDNEILHMTTDTSSDFILEMDDNKLFPLGIQFIFFLAGITIQFCWSMIKNLPCFRIGTPLPDVLYKMMNLTRSKWESIFLDAVLEHNK